MPLLRYILVGCASLSLLASVQCTDEPAAAPSPRDAGLASDARASASRDAAAPVRSTEPTPPVAQPRSIRCGTEECSIAPNPLIKVLEDFGGFQTMLLQAHPCCLDAGRGTCGITPAPGAECEPLAVPDVRCPGLDLQMLSPFAEGMNVVGCCVDDVCGQDGALLGRGCIENDEAASNFSFIPAFARGAQFPAAVSCSASRLGEDAGAADAGR